tara:strand:- start:1339 stop:1800 length:462 start_codon:yes stop_codon:yes gene_type:complete
MLYYLWDLLFRIIDVYQGLQPCESTKGRDIRRIPEHVDKLLILFTLKLNKMNKAQAIALLEYNTQKEDYTTSEDFHTSMRDGIDSNKDFQLDNKSLGYRSEVTSFIHNKMKYHCISVLTQHWTGDYSQDSVVYFKQRYSTPEEIIARFSFLSN